MFDFIFITKLQNIYMNQMYATGVILMLIVLLINGCSGMIAKKIAKK